MSEPMNTSLNLFFLFLDHNYKLNAKEYLTITSVDMNCFKDRLTSFSNQDTVSDLSYDPIMEPLVHSSLAHFLYIKKYSIPFLEFDNGVKLPDLNAFHPNYIRFAFLDSLVSTKSSLTLESLKYLLFTPSTAPINREKLMLKVHELLQNNILESLVNSFILNELLVDSDPLIAVKAKKPTRSLLYFILMDLYLEYIDHLVHSTINSSGLACFWARTLNAAIMGFTNKKTPPKLEKILKLGHILPAWGLTAKVSTGLMGGRVLRPWLGKLYLNKEGHLQWERPESIIDK